MKMIALAIAAVFGLLGLALWLVTWPFKQLHTFGEWLMEMAEFEAEHL